jgi:hypothetical protein
MDPVTCSRTTTGRRWSLRLTTAAVVLLPFALGAGAPAWGNGSKAPHGIIFDPAA